MRRKILCFDATNILYRTFYANKSEPDEQTMAGLAHHASLNTINKYFKQYNPEKVILTFDRPNWRKEYTKSDLCISGKIYKGHRRQNMSESQKKKFNAFMDHMSEFEDFLNKHTKIITMSANLLEADDLIAGVVEKYDKDSERDVIVVSADSDLLQVLKFDNVTLINPADGKEKTLEEYDYDPDWFMFLKCIRGDLNDNVEKAFPNVRTTRLKKAYVDNYERAQLMNETWTNVNGVTFKVGDLFEENKLLMDLFSQPEPVRGIIRETIDSALQRPQKFSFFDFTKFCGKYELKRVLENSNQFFDLLGR